MTCRRIVVPSLMLLTAILLAGCGTGAGNPGLNGAGGGSGSGQTDTLFSDGFETGITYWTGNSFWGMSDEAYSGNYCLKAEDSQSTANLILINNYFNLLDYGSATLTFWNKSTVSDMLPYNALKRIYVYINSDPDPTQAWAESFEFSQDWSAITVSLDSFCGTNGQLQIGFSYYKFGNGGIDWWIDDVEITAE